MAADPSGRVALATGGGRAIGRSIVVAADLSQTEGLETVFDALRREYAILDVLVNNAGLGISGPLIEFSEESLDTLLAVNVKRLFLCCQQAMRQIVPARRWYIINISSVVGFKTSAPY